MIDGRGISWEIALRWMSLDVKSTLIQVMALCRQATSHYLGQFWSRSLSPYEATRPQWVNCMCHVEVDRRHFQMNFISWQSWYFSSHFTDFSIRVQRQQIIIGWGNGLQWLCDAKLSPALTMTHLTETFHLNTLRPRQMAAIFQTTFSNALSWMKMY